MPMGDLVLSQVCHQPGAFGSSIGEATRNRCELHGMGALVTTNSTFVDFSDDGSLGVHAQAAPFKL